MRIIKKGERTGEMGRKTKRVKGRTASERQERC